jgi:hypothetical protein
LKGFSNISTFSTADDGRPIGGSSIFIDKNIPHHFLNLNTPLQAVAAQVHLQKLITVCSLYLPPTFQYTALDLQNLINQLPSPVLLLGDFNAHSTLWGCDQSLNDAKEIESFMENEDLILLNDGSYTYVHPGNGARTAIDLSLCHPEIYLDFIWKLFRTNMEVTTILYA